MEDDVREDMTKVLQQRKDPFVWPELEWEKKSMTGYTTVANALVPFKGKWHLYYGGADTVTGLATCPIEKPWVDSLAKICVAKR